MIDWGKRVLLGALLGAAIGVLVGLALGRLLWPSSRTAQATGSPASPGTASPAATAPAASSPVGLSTATAPAPAGDAALLWVSALYAHDGDLARARDRLAVQGIEDPGRALGDLALRYASAGSGQVAVDLATLAAALGDRRPDLIAYVATPTPQPTATPTPAPTLTPTDTPSPVPSPTPAPSATRRPAATRVQAPKPTSAPAEPTAPPLVWDHRVDLLSPPVSLLPADVASRQVYWKLVRLEWWRASQGGNCLIYVTTLKQDGNPKWGQLVYVEHGVKDQLYTDPKPGEPYGANYRMNSTLNSYIVYVGGDLPSDRVTGLGMGEWLGGLDHTTFVLVFQLARK